MTKDEISARLAEALELSNRKDARRIYDRVCVTIADILDEELFISLPFLGTLTVVDREERTCRTPQGGTVTVPAHKTVKFSPAKYLKKKVN